MVRSPWLKDGDRERILESARNEFTILRRLKYRHIVSVLELYQYNNLLAIIMEQIADSDLAEYLRNTDELSDDNDRKETQRSIMRTWSGCLIQALDYLHEMKIKHKDIKPANILVMGGQVLLADFGISKDLIDKEMTASIYRGNWYSFLFRTRSSLRQSKMRTSNGCVFIRLCLL